MADHNYLANQIWQVTDLLRGPYRPAEYRRVILPMTVLRRFDCVLASSKAKASAKPPEDTDSNAEGDTIDQRLNRTAGQALHNRSSLNLLEVRGDPDNIDRHLASYVKEFSKSVRDIFEFFQFEDEIQRMREASILYLVVSRFADIDLHPDSVPNEQMGLVFRDLIERSNQLASKMVSDQFTPPDVARLMVSMLFIEVDQSLAEPGFVRRLLDPACGTGGMLAEAQTYMREHNGSVKLLAYGQDYNQWAFATAASDMLMKHDVRSGGGDSIRFGDSLIDDQFKGETFDYFLTDPPFRVEWKKRRKVISQECDPANSGGRFGAGFPHVNDGSLLFLQHMWDKRESLGPTEQTNGSRLAIVLNGLPLFTGGAGSGESSIRRRFIENDWLEAIIALPEQLFYNSDIGTYIWIVTNRKEERRIGKIQLLDARSMWTAGTDEGKSYGSSPKRRHLSHEQIKEIVSLYRRFQDSDHSKILDNADFGYTRIRIERPMRLRYCMSVEDKSRFLDACPHLLDDLQAIDEALGRKPMSDWNAVWSRIEDLLHSRQSRWKLPEKRLFRHVFTEKDLSAAPVTGGTGEGFEPDPSLREFDKVPLKHDLDAYFKQEVLPHEPDAWMDRNSAEIGYEIHFKRYFYERRALRPLDEIDADLKHAEEELLRLLREVTV